MKNCVLLVYPGLGKTYSAKNFNSVEDIRLSFYENLNIEKFDKFADESIKGTEIEMLKNPNFPQNLIDFLNNTLNNNKIPVMALKVKNINFLIENNFNFAFVMPAQDKIEELQQQYIKRGNKEFVVKRNIDKICEVQKQIELYNKTIFFVHKGEHLQDIITKM